MFPLFSKGRKALFCVALVAMGYCIFEPFILLMIVRHTSWLSSIPSRTAVLRAGQVGRLAEGIIIEALQSQDMVVQIIACRLLRNRKTKAAVNQLGYLITSPNRVVRKEATAALEAITGHKYSQLDFTGKNRKAAEELIKEILSRDPDIRKYARKRMAKIGLPAVSVLVASLENLRPEEAPSSTAWLLEALAGFGYGYPPSLIVPYIERQDADIRLGAEKALKAQGDVVVPHLLPYLDTRRFWAFKSAVNVLAEVRPNIAARHLADKLVNKTTASDTRRANFYRALGRLKSPEGLYALTVGAEFESEPRLRLAAVEALGKISHPKVVPALMRAVRDEDKDVRQAAIEGLYKHGSPEAHKVLTDQYLSKDLNRNDLQKIDNLLRGAGLSSDGEKQ